jgi:hypothetical protein
VHRRFAEWSAARVRARPYRILPDERGARGELDRSRRAIDFVSMRAMKAGNRQARILSIAARKDSP